MQIGLVIGGLPKHYLSVLKARPKDGWDYNGKNFNALGDETAHWQAEAPGNNEPMSAQSEDVSRAVVNDFAEKVNLLKRRDVTTITLWPTTIQTNYENHKLFITALASEFGRHGLEFNNSPTTFVHPDSMAFDTPYHLSYPAVKNNTDSLIQIILLTLARESKQL